MHFALVREVIRDDLGCDPEEAFAAFRTGPMARTSLGQVHRAVLPSGRPVAVKIQYPGIDREVRSGCGAACRSASCDDFSAPLEDVCQTAERKADYRAEADALRLARRTLGGEGRVMVPRVHGEYSARRVLTADLVPGVPARDYLASGPSRAARDAYGTLICRVFRRLGLDGRMLHADPDLEDFLFAKADGPGVVGLGGARPLGDEWGRFVAVDEALRRGDPDALAGRLAGDDDRTAGDDRRELLAAWARWLSRPARQGGPFDFADRAHLREGSEALLRMVAGGCLSGRPSSLRLARAQFGLATLLHQLGACVDFGALDAV